LKVSCYFCQKEKLNGERWDRHHVIPRRYRGRSCYPKEKNKKWAHVFCHRVWHFAFDIPTVRERGVFDEKFKDSHYGEGVFRTPEGQRVLHTAQSDAKIPKDLIKASLGALTSLVKAA